MCVGVWFISEYGVLCMAFTNIFLFRYFEVKLFVANNKHAGCDF